MKRIGQTDDIAIAALYLASPASSWVTGKLFEIDGGAEAPTLPLGLPDLTPLRERFNAARGKQRIIGLFSPT